VKVYQSKFVITLMVMVPIQLLAWVVPYLHPSFLTAYDLVEGNTLYLFILLFFSSIIQFGSGWGFYVGAYKSIKHGAANMDVLVVLGTTSAWLYGVILMFMGRDLSMYDTEEMKNMQI
jgi:P-type Cu+ transporter